MRAAGLWPDRVVDDVRSGPQIARMSRSIQRGMAIALVALPAFAVFVLLVGGERVSGGCGVGPAGCLQRASIPGPFPIIGTREGVAATLVLLAAMWVVSIVVLSALAVRRDRAASAEWAIRILRTAFVVGIAGFAYGYLSGGRLRTGAEFALGGSTVVGYVLLVGALLESLGWANLRHEREAA